jgi:hypothetical protein
MVPELWNKTYRIGVSSRFDVLRLTSWRAAKIAAPQILRIRKTHTTAALLGGLRRLGRVILRALSLCFRHIDGVSAGTTGVTTVEPAQSFRQQSDARRKAISIPHPRRWLGTDSVNIVDSNS